MKPDCSTKNIQQLLRIGAKALELSAGAYDPEEAAEMRRKVKEMRSVAWNVRREITYAKNSAVNAARKEGFADGYAKGERA